MRLRRNRATLFCRRIVQGLCYGMIFRGTRYSHLPKSLRVRGRSIRLRTLSEASLAWDFVNIWLDDEYGLRKLRAPPKTVIDVGCNIGLFSLFAARIFPEAIIHAYEPNGRVYSVARENLKPLATEVYQEAVSSRDGFVRVQDEVNSRLAQTEACDSGEIRSVSLARAIGRIGGQVDLLKLDCEGCEWEIFKELSPFKNVSNIRMEYHLGSSRSLADLSSVLTGAGFSINHLFENSGFGIAWCSRTEGDR
jgi:FkbM family methyltransferase